MAEGAAGAQPSGGLSVPEANQRAADAPLTAPALLFVRSRALPAGEPRDDPAAQDALDGAADTAAGRAKAREARLRAFVLAQWRAAEDVPAAAFVLPGSELHFVPLAPTAVARDELGSKLPASEEPQGSPQPRLRERLWIVTGNREQIGGLIAQLAAIARTADSTVASTEVQLRRAAVPALPKAEPAPERAAGAAAAREQAPELQRLVLRFQSVR